jgi:valyl-tRNA synthetase
VAVHPEDKRYMDLIGKEFEINFCGSDIKIKIVADSHVDPEFGTGALGVTPAHSKAD